MISLLCLPVKTKLVGLVGKEKHCEGEDELMTMGIILYIAFLFCITEKIITFSFQVIEYHRSIMGIVTLNEDEFGLCGKAL